MIQGNRYKTETEIIKENGGFQEQERKGIGPGMKQIWKLEEKLEEKNKDMCSFKCIYM
jgi:hypothetical protein